MEQNPQIRIIIYRIERINRIVDKNDYLTTTVKINRTEKDFIIDTGSAISIMPADKEIMKETEKQKTKHRFEDVNKDEVKFRGKIQEDIENEKNKRKIQLQITERSDITPLLGMNWQKEIQVNIRVEENR